MASAQVAVATKPQVSDLIRKVEEGVDEFEKYLERRGDNARDRADDGGSRRGRRRNRSAAATDSRPERANPLLERIWRPNDFEKVK